MSAAVAVGWQPAGVVTWSRLIMVGDHVGGAAMVDGAGAGVGFGSNFANVGAAAADVSRTAHRAAATVAPRCLRDRRRGGGSHLWVGPAGSGWC